MTKTSPKQLIICRRHKHIKEELDKGKITPLPALKKKSQPFSIFFNSCVK